MQKKIKLGIGYGEWGIGEPVLREGFPTEASGVMGHRALGIGWASQDERAIALTECKI
ncbi:MAG: hypothetical protein ACHBN1_27430 [Heteroscytonema crispum UTEX LB 1556]